MVLLREREDRPWLLFGAEFATETSVVWDGGVSGVRYGTDSPTGDVDDAPKRDASGRREPYTRRPPVAWSCPRPR